MVRALRSSARSNLLIPEWKVDFWVSVEVCKMHKPILPRTRHPKVIDSHLQLAQLIIEDIHRT